MANAAALQAIKRPPATKVVTPLAKPLGEPETADAEVQTIEPTELSVVGTPAYLQAKCSTCDKGSQGAAATIHRTASDGVAHARQPLPGAAHIQAAFGRHDISDVRAQVGGAAEQASTAMGARAYTMGRRIGFKQAPDLRLAAHEAAHTVQQRRGVQLKGGVGAVGDVYEQHADAVAERVVSGQSAEDLLDAQPVAEKTAKPAFGVQAKCACGGTCSKCAAPPQDELLQQALQLDLEANATREFEAGFGSPDSRSEVSSDGGGGGEGGGGADGAGDRNGGAADDGNAEASADAPTDAADSSTMSTPDATTSDASGGGSTAGITSASAPTNSSSPADAGMSVDPSMGGMSSMDGGSSATPAPAVTSASPAASTGAASTAPPTGGGAGGGAGGGGATPQCYRGRREEPDPAPENPPANPPAGEVQHETNEGEDEEAPEADNCSAATGAPDGGTASSSPASSAMDGGSATSATSSAAPADATAGATSSAGGAAASAGGGASAAPIASPAALVSPLEGLVGAAEGARAGAVGSYASSRSALSGAAAGVASLRDGVTFNAAGVEAGAARVASARMNRFFNATADRLDAACTQALQAIPDQIGVTLASGKAQIVAALASEKSAISDRIEQARGQARSDAVLARGAVRAQATSYMAAVRSQSAAAIASLRAAHTTASGQIDTLSTTTLASVNTTYATGRSNMEAVGTTLGEECTTQGEAFATTYEGFSNCTENGFWDGDLSQRRAAAQAKAARETAKGYHDRLVSAARQRAREATRDARKRDRCLIINAATQCHSGLDSTLSGLVSAIEQSRDSALAQAASARDGLLSSIQSGLQGTLAQLDQQAGSQRQTANDTAYMQQLLLEQTAHSSVAGLQNAVRAAIEQAQQGLRTVQAQCDGRTSPSAPALDAALLQVEGKISAALGGLGSAADGAASDLESRLAGSTSSGIAALAGVSASSAEQAEAVAGGFTQSMSTLAGQDNFASQRASFTTQITQSTSTGTSTLNQVVSGFRSTCSGVVSQATQTLAQAQSDLTTNLRQQRQGLEGDMVSHADEAASHEAPAWKTLVAVLLIIVVIIIVVAVIVASGGAALGPLGAMIAAMGPILTGAVVGAITSGLLYLATNLLQNNDVTLGGFAQAVAIGAVTGAIGGGLGAWAGGAMGAATSTASAGVQLAGQFAAALAVNVGMDITTQFVMGGFSFEHFSFKQLGFTVVVTAVTFGIGHASARIAAARAPTVTEPPPTAAAGELAPPSSRPASGASRVDAPDALPISEPTLETPPGGAVGDNPVSPGGAANDNAVPGSIIDDVPVAANDNSYPVSASEPSAPIPIRSGGRAGGGRVTASEQGAFDGSAALDIHVSPGPRAAPTPVRASAVRAEAKVIPFPGSRPATAPIEIPEPIVVPEPAPSIPEPLPAPEVMPAVPAPSVSPSPVVTPGVAPGPSPVPGAATGVVTGVAAGVAGGVAVAMGSSAPVTSMKPAGLSPADDALADQCMAQHDKYKAIQGTVATRATEIRNLLQKVQNGTITAAERFLLCQLLDKQIAAVFRLWEQRTIYIDMDCDRIPWVGSKYPTPALRRTAHQNEADAVSRQYDNLVALKARLRAQGVCP